MRAMHTGWLRLFKCAMEVSYYRWKECVKCGSLEQQIFGDSERRVEFSPEYCIK